MERVFVVLLWGVLKFGAWLWGEKFVQDLVSFINSKTHYVCDQCHAQFMIPQTDFDKVACPNCGREWGVKGLAKLKKLW